MSRLRLAMYTETGRFVVRLYRGEERQYHPSDFDYLAAYIIPKDAWYIIPFALLGPQSSIRVWPGHKSNRYERYREAWHLLREPPLTVTPGVPLDEDVRHQRRPSSAT